MGGSGGGGQSNNQQAEQTLQVPLQEYAAFYPGQQGLLAQQMQQGYDGLLSDHQNAMSYYQPMSIPMINRPGDVTAYVENLGLEPAENSSKATKVKGSGGGGSGGGIINNIADLFSQRDSRESR
ncbi:hypothetical protein [Pseudohoeflea coraliihabitans]|uniref:Uncharacterized protein n=1 Tax=Pseudohoeflea coraliihabitans TaxID=2860393 RepID=A0ABS6WTE6_9HYPH|nr:hypothetical protein [Pseudohoeflea sp. DP4N28-3]MBW3099234.1 hypothetical protein [Pseudohoeflea sp. DP4N28-3]